MDYFIEFLEAELLSFIEAPVPLSTPIFLFYPLSGWFHKKDFHSYRG